MAPAPSSWLRSSDLSTSDANAGRVAQATATSLRGVAETMNLRSTLFRIGAGAVMGERVFLPATWIEPPYDTNAEAVAMCARAARMHKDFASTFRTGMMLGQAHVTSGNRAVQAWRVRLRTFNDIPESMAHVQNPVTPEDDTIYDVRVAISRGTDDDAFSHVITTEQIQHMVWSKSSTTLY